MHKYKPFKITNWFTTNWLEEKCIGLINSETNIIINRSGIKWIKSQKLNFVCLLINAFKLKKCNILLDASINEAKFIKNVEIVVINSNFNKRIKTINTLVTVKYKDSRITKKRFLTIILNNITIIVIDKVIIEENNSKSGIVIIDFINYINLFSRK